jgi:hypothetical protein
VHTNRVLFGGWISLILPFSPLFLWFGSGCVCVSRTGNSLTMCTTQRIAPILYIRPSGQHSSSSSSFFSSFFPTYGAGDLNWVEWTLPEYLRFATRKSHPPPPCTYWKDLLMQSTPYVVAVLIITPWRVWPKTHLDRWGFLSFDVAYFLSHSAKVRKIRYSCVHVGVD